MNLQRDETAILLTGQRHRPSLAHELPLRSDVKQSVGDFLVAFVVTRSPRPATISDVPGRGDGKGRPVMVGRCGGKEEDRRGPLRSGRAIKVFAHERVEAEEAGERRACKKEKSKGRGKSLSCRRSHSASTRLNSVQLNAAQRSAARCGALMSRGR